ALHLGHFLGALVDEQHDEGDFGVVAHDGLGDVLHHDGLARLGGRHDQAPLALADGGDEVGDAAGEVLGAAVARLQHQPLVGEQGREVLEEDLVAGVFRLVEVDVIDLEQGEVALAFLGGADLAGDAVAGAQVEAPDLAGGDIDVDGAGQVGGVGGSQITNTIGEDSENTVTGDVLDNLGGAHDDSVGY